MHADDRLCWVTDLGWIMGPWELVGGLAAGGTIVLLEGAPDYPAADRLWSLVERHRRHDPGGLADPDPCLDETRHRAGSLARPFAGCEFWRRPASRGTPSRGAGCSSTPAADAVRSSTCRAGRRSAPACCRRLPITPLKPCSLAGPALGMAVDVFDAAGKPLRHGVGELVCTKPWPAMTRGIWGDPDRYIATYWSRWPDVWVHGDWASIDDDGDWFLHGRSDDTLNVAGKRLGPAEVESILAEHAAVAESAAIGVPDSLKGEVIHCFAVLKHGHEPADSLRSELRERVAHALGKSFAPDEVRFVTELPKTRSGKILRRLIRKVALGQDPGDLSSLENLAAIEAIRQGT